MRLLLALLLLAVAGFAVFGFLASFELAEPADRLPWQAGYGLLGVLSLGGTIGILRARRR